MQVVTKCFWIWVFLTVLAGICWLLRSLIGDSVGLVVLVCIVMANGLLVFWVAILKGVRTKNPSPEERQKAIFALAEAIQRRRQRIKKNL
jgi:hypothetical protein